VLFINKKSDNTVGFDANKKPAYVNISAGGYSKAGIYRERDTVKPVGGRKKFIRRLRAQNK